jgi:hypothetical protein
MPQSLETRTNVPPLSGLFVTLLQRSCVAMLMVLGIIALISMFPTGNSSTPDEVSVERGRDAILRHVLEINRHGA